MLSFLFPRRRQSTPESLIEDHVRHGDSDNENENGSENENEKQYNTDNGTNL